MKDFAIFTGFAFVLSLLIFGIYIFTPVVQVNSHGECVAVWSHWDHSCAKMPKKYVMEHVQ